MKLRAPVCDSCTYKKTFSCTICIEVLRDLGETGYLGSGWKYYQLESISTFPLLTNDIIKTRAIIAIYNLKYPGLNLAIEE